MVTYKAKNNKTVTLLSSLHCDKTCENSEKSKPEIVLFYNKTKCGVDALDERISTYSTKIITRRWHAIVFFNILDIALFNAFVIHKEVNPSYHSNNSKSRRMYLKQLGKSLIQKNITRRSIKITLSNTVCKQIIIPDPPNVQNRKRGRCKLCSREDDTKTTNVCIQCQSFVCKQHLNILCQSCISSTNLNQNLF